MPSKRTLWVLMSLAVIVAVVGGGVAGAGGLGDDDEQPITGEAYTKASEAALKHTGGGIVTGTEVSDEESYYEVEVTLADGRQVDVQLDRDFNVVGTEVDDESDLDGGSDLDDLKEQRPDSSGDRDDP